jgi:hypothetical protein
MPSRQTRRRKQRGGAVGTVKSAIPSIRNKQDDLQSAVSLVKEQELSEALETAFTSTGGGRETEADIRYYVESMLKDEKTAEDLFPDGDLVPDQYAALIGVLDRYSKMRNDMDSLIKSIYRYINLRISAYTHQIGPVENVQYQNRGGRQGQGKGLPFATGRNQGGEPMEGLPEFSRGFGGKPAGEFSKSSGLPQFSRIFGGSNDPNEYNNNNRLLRRRSFRKKN